MYNNRVLVGNWYEERFGKFVSQKDGNNKSTYQTDYRTIANLPIQDNNLAMQKIRIKSMVIISSIIY